MRKLKEEAEGTLKGELFTERLTVGDWGEFQNCVERTLQVGQLI